MKADAYELGIVFGYNRQLFAPLFQRPYVWEKERQWKPFWDDTRVVAERLLRDPEDLRPHFLGAIVLEQLRVPVGRPDSRSIIDGQQRLATIQILLGAVRDICVSDQRLAKLGESVELLMFNHSVMVDEEDDRYKVWPTNTDHAAYRIVMSTRSPEEAKAELAKNAGADKSNIVQAYLYFYSTVREWATDEDGLSEQRLRALVNTIRQGLLLVVVDMGSEDNAQLIFETLNARGTPLLPSDLVKNFLFQAAKEKKLNVEALYISCWHPFDYNHAFWREEITQGRLKRPRIDLLLQHYLTLQKNDEVSARSLFREFQQLSRDNPHRGPDWFLKSLKQHGDYFRHFLTVTPDSREGTFFTRLKTMDTTTVFPFLLGLYESIEEKRIDEAQRLDILIAVESFLVRRMVCRMTTKNYNRLFLDLLSEMTNQGRFSYDAVRSFLSAQTAEANKWPSDGEFRDAWLNMPIYHAITRPRLRMILTALDEGLHGSMTESYKLLATNLTVEHLMPQLWRDHWPLVSVADETYEEKTDRQAKRDRAIQTIGNLLYLTKSLNPYVSNGPFERKKEAILKHSAINLNRIWLENAVQWDESSIRKRSEALFDLALRIWPGPDERIQDEVRSAVISAMADEDAKRDTAEAATDDELVERGFFEEALQALGEEHTSALRTFCSIAENSPYRVSWHREDQTRTFEIEFPALCAGSLVSVHADGVMDINSRNMQGSENANLFREALRDALRYRIGLAVPDTAEETHWSYPVSLWIDRSDDIMEILDSLIDKYVDLENS